jgi:hypothetical protein
VTRLEEKTEMERISRLQLPVTAVGDTRQLARFGHCLISMIYPMLWDCGTGGNALTLQAESASALPNSFYLDNVAQKVVSEV